jgi:hypothetical protein
MSDYPDLVNAERAATLIAEVEDAPQTFALFTYGYIRQGALEQRVSAIWQPDAIRRSPI